MGRATVHLATLIPSRNQLFTKDICSMLAKSALVKSWLREAGAHNVLVTSAVNNTLCAPASRNQLFTKAD
ncbi:hypothetical protein PSY44_23885, partial [Shigella flexneri]|nr:hypothetical protein [Shigella flexneri]